MSISQKDEQEISHGNNTDQPLLNDAVIERSDSELLRIKNEKEINLNRAIGLIYDSKRPQSSVILSEREKEFIILQLSQLKFFSDLVQKCRLKSFCPLCLEHLNVETFSQGSILFHKGDKTDKIHVITKGELVIFQDKTPKELLEDQIIYKRTKNKNMSIYDKIFLKKNMRKLEYLSQGVLTVKNIQKLRVGDHFGDTRSSSEVELKQESVYLACTNLKVITIYKDIFENLLTIALDETNKQRFRFFKQLLPSSPLISLVQFIQQVKEKFYKYKEYIYEENEQKPKFLYIIRDGEVTIQIHPSDDLKKQYKSRVELAILGEFEAFGDESISGNQRKTDAQSRTKQGVNVYFFKAKELTKQSDLNENILKLLERNSKLKSEFQKTQLISIKTMNKEIEKQNEQMLKKKETIFDQIITELSSTQRKQLQSMGTYVDQNIIEQTYDVKSDMDDLGSGRQQYNRNNQINQLSLKMRQSTAEITSQSKSKNALISVPTKCTNIHNVNNSFDSAYTAYSNLNSKKLLLNQSQNFKKNQGDSSQFAAEVISSLNKNNHSQRLRNQIIQNSQSTLNTYTVQQPLDINCQQTSNNLFEYHFQRKKSHSVFISHGLEESIFKGEDDEEVLNNFSSIEKMRQVKVKNFNKLCDTQRINDNKERISSPNSQCSQHENTREELPIRSQKSSLQISPSTSPINRSPSRKAPGTPFITSEQLYLQQLQLPLEAGNLLTQRHTKYPYKIRKQNIYDKMRIEDQSLNNESNVTPRIEDQINLNHTKFQKSFITHPQRLNEKHYHHQQIASANKSPTEFCNTFRQKNDKTFSNVKNQFFTKKHMNQMKNFIFTVEGSPTPPSNPVERKPSSQMQMANESYQLNQNDLPLLNLYRIQHKQSIKYHSEPKQRNIQPLKQSKVILNKKVDKEEKYLPTFHLDYSLM